MCFLFFHKWNKWETYKVRVRTLHPYFINWYSDQYSEHEEIRQKRTCSVCGKEQDRKVR